MGACAPCCPRGQSSEQNTSLIFFFFMSKSCTYCSPGSKHFWKEDACPSFSVYEATFQGSVYLAAASASSSQPIAGTIPSHTVCSLVLGGGQVIVFAQSPGWRLWNSKAQKVQWGLTFLYLNLPPTTLLPCSSARCSMQGTRSGRLSGPKWVREKEPEGKSTDSVLRKQNSVLSHLGGTWQCQVSALCFHPIRLGWAGTVLERQEQPMGCGKAASLSAGQGVLRGWTEGKVWQGESLFGQWA